MVSEANWVVEKGVNDLGTVGEEEVWNIVRYYHNGDSCEHLADCGATRCHGTFERATMMAASPLLVEAVERLLAGHDVDEARKFARAALRAAKPPKRRKK